MIRTLVIAIFGFLLPSVGIANSCTLKSRVCVDSVQPKSISGLNVYFSDVGITDGCWQWRSTYDCVDPGAPSVVNYCSPLENTPDCAITSSVCAEYSAVNGTCNTYTNTYRCGNPVSSASNAVVLGQSYTLSLDTIDQSPCKTYSDNTSCTLASEICTDGPATKVIFANGLTRLATPPEITTGISPDGIVKYQACWNWKRDYTCLVGNYKNYCQPLVAAGCVESSPAVCRNTGWDGSCLEYDRTYNCGTKVDPPPSNVIHLDSTYTIIGETAPTTCTDPATNPNCVKAGEVCVDGPSTKVVMVDGSTRLATTTEIATGVSPDGAVVSKACWKTDTTYTCATTPRVSTCEPLQTDTACSQTGTSCVDYLPGGQCGVLQHIYKCKTGSERVENVTDCSLQQFCSDGKCFDTGYQPDADFGKSVAYMEAIRQAAQYNIFKGEAGHCTGNPLENCCKAKGGGGGGSNNAIANALGTAALKAGAETIYVYGSKYIFEGLMNTGSTMLMEYAMSAMASGILSTTSTFSVWGATFSVSASSGIAFVGFDPWSLAISAAIYIIMDMMKCEQSEQILGMRRGQGLCHHVGTWCSSKALGSCLKKKEGWCCFPSKLGRIVNQQGRAQIGKSWGTPQSPDCSGFTLEELEKLRFDQMDLSEFIADIQAQVKSNSFAVERLDAKAKSYYAPE